MNLGNKIIKDFSESIFSQMTKLANQYSAVNLAQGFPDFDGPSYAFKFVQSALENGKNQYAPSFGQLSLKESITSLYSENYKIKFNSENEVLVTNGATEGIYLTIMSLLNPGDEVILIEPFYDSYLASLKMAGANIKIISLTEDNFCIDYEKLKKIISNKTKMIIFNNPHNPTGKVFSNDELNNFVKIISHYDVIVLSDEVYEYITYDENHIPLARFEEIKDKVITISSIGKTFSFTGWKIGWAIGPAKYIDLMHKLHQFVTFCVATPLQEAVSKLLLNFQEYDKEFKKMYLEKRNFFCDGLEKNGLNVIRPKGSYFSLVKLNEGQDSSIVAIDLIKNQKIASIPLTAFFIESNLGKKYLRFCFAKKESTLQLALKRLEHEV